MRVSSCKANTGCKDTEWLEQNILQGEHRVRKHRVGTAEYLNIPMQTLFQLVVLKLQCMQRSVVAADDKNCILHHHSDSGDNRNAALPADSSYCLLCPCLGSCACCLC